MLVLSRDIDCLEHITNVSCQDFEDGTRFELRLTFNIKTNKTFTDESLIKRYEVPNLPLDDEPILKNVMGWNIHWKEGRRFTYTDINKKHRSKSVSRVGQIRTFNKRERTDSFFHFFG